MKPVNKIILHKLAVKTKSEMQKHFRFAHWYHTPLNIFQDRRLEKESNFYSIIRDISNLYFLEKDQLKILS